MSEDSHLQRLVLAELNWEPSVPAGHIGVAAEQGVVTLTGHVPSYAEKIAAEKGSRPGEGGQGRGRADRGPSARASPPERR
ncbi:BON domain-containing protein [Sphingomonas oryzagri]